MDQRKGKGGVARADIRQRSDSRKRNRRSESPEEKSISAKDKHLKRSRKLTQAETPKNQPKITDFNSENRSEEKDTTTNMATSAEVKMLMEEMQKMNAKFDEMNMNLVGRIEKVESRVFDTEQAQDNTKKDIDKIKKNLELHEELTAELEHTTHLALTQADRQEQYNRNYNIRIFNVPEDDNESIYDCENKVLALFEEKLNLKISIDSIDNLHRLGPKHRINDVNKSDVDGDKEKNVNKEKKDERTDNETNDNMEEGEVGQQKDNHDSQNQESEGQGENQSNQNNDSSKKKINECRPIIVSFVSRRVRRQVLANRNRLKKKIGQTTAPIIIVEDLTKKNHALLCKAKDNTDKYKNVWSKDGVIYGKQLNDVIVRINSFKEVSMPPIDKQARQRHSYGKSHGSNYTQHSWGFPLHRRGRGQARGFHRGFPRGANRSYRGDVTSLYLDRGLSVSNRFQGLQDVSDNEMTWS